MRALRRAWALGLVGWMTGCTTVAPTPLSPAGRQVLPLAADPGPACTNLGNITGSGQGEDTAAKVDSALNDAKNQAAGHGATHVFISALAFGQAHRFPSAILTTIAYRCPPGVVSQVPADAAAPSSGPRSFLSSCPQKEGESTLQRAQRCRAAEKQIETPPRG